VLKNFRDRFAIICVAAAALAGSGSALAQSHVEVSLAAPEIRDPAHPAIVHLRIKNAGDQPVSIMKWDTPFVGFRNRLAKSIFEVKDEHGNEVLYSGSWAYFGRLVMDSFITLYPGQVIEKDVDIEKEYRFRPNGTYKIRYVLSLNREPDPDEVSSAERASFFAPNQAEAASGFIEITFGDRLAVRNQGADDDELKCDAQQSLTISRIRLATSRRITAGEAFLRERYVATLENGHIRYVFKPHPRYTRWFGVHDDSEPEIYSDGWGLNNNARVFETALATTKRILAPEQSIRCGCPDVTDERVSAHADTEST
jgi:hypothetical protein